MSLSLEDKKAVVERVSSVLSDAQTAIVAEYRGMTVEKMTSLRREAREAGVYFQVVKNTLARRAVKGSDFECLDEHFLGPLALAASEDPVAAAKVLSKFEKAEDAFSIKVGAMSGNLLSLEEINALAKLPGREELLATLLGTMQAPIIKFVQTLNEIPSKFVRTLSAVRDAKEAS
ncbi:MAG: 50S ribosomal protein L10 [Arenicellales bacterium]|nr:50S ribosomal protein L10 [Arenicellales bacterium]